MSRTTRHYKRGILGDRNCEHQLGWIDKWKINRDGPANLGPGKKFKLKYRRKDRRKLSRFTEDDPKPVLKKVVDWEFY